MVIKAHGNTTYNNTKQTYRDQWLKIIKMAIQKEVSVNFCAPEKVKTSNWFVSWILNLRKMQQWSSYFHFHILYVVSLGEKVFILWLKEFCKQELSHLKLLKYLKVSWKSYKKLRLSIEGPTCLGCSNPIIEHDTLTGATVFLSSTIEQCISSSQTVTVYK